MTYAKLETCEEYVFTLAKFLSFEEEIWI